MKHFLTTLSILFSLTAFGQLSIKEIDKSLVKINDQLYASKFEVTNRQYIDFLNSLIKTYQAGKLKTAQIDSAKWADKLAYNVPYVTYYHRHPAYKDYPVVTITYEGAKLFCEWLTDRYNSDPKRKFKKVIFRLPSEKEWMIAAQGGDHAAIYPWPGNKLINKKGLYLCNFSRPYTDTAGIAGSLNDAADITAPVNSYYPNKYGLYNMSGNVAEMIIEKGIAKGGSWKEKSEYLKIDAKYQYDGSAQNIYRIQIFCRDNRKITGVAKLPAK